MRYGVTNRHAAPSLFVQPCVFIAIRTHMGWTPDLSSWMPVLSQNNFLARQRDTHPNKSDITIREGELGREGTEYAIHFFTPPLWSDVL